MTGGGRSCAACGADRPVGARFCPACGAATRQHVRALAASAVRQRRATGRAALALGLACAGPLLGLAVGLGAGEEGGDRASLPVLLPGLWLLLSGLAAALLVGPNGMRRSLAGPPAPRWLVLAAPLAALTFVLSWGWVLLLQAVLGADGAASAADGAAAWFALLVAAPLLEEWLCRGVAWDAAVRLGGRHSALWVSAVLFAFLHGMNGGYLLEVPHRLLGGLALGWLRLRSGSLVPGMLAHLLHNAAAVAVG